MIGVDESRGGKATSCDWQPDAAGSVLEEAERLPPPPIPVQLPLPSARQLGQVWRAPYAIGREIAPNFEEGWKYTIAKDGATASKARGCGWHCVKARNGASQLGRASSLPKGREGRSTSDQSGVWRTGGTYGRRGRGDVAGGTGVRAVWAGTGPVWPTHTRQFGPSKYAVAEHGARAVLDPLE